MIIRVEMPYGYCETAAGLYVPVQTGITRLTTEDGKPVSHAARESYKAFIKKEDN